MLCLRVEHLGVLAVLCHQLLMTARLGDAAVGEHVDGLRHAGGRETVRDENYGRVGALLEDVVVECILGQGVERG